MFKKLTIKARGIGFYILLLIIGSLFIIPSLYLMICFFIPNNEMYGDYLALIVCIIGFSFYSYQMILVDKKRKVVFEDTYFITQGQNEKIFPPIREDCRNFVNYRCLTKLGAQCIEFQFVDNRNVLFHTMQFSKKQILAILNEIQKRGGFNDVKIDIK